MPPLPSRLLAQITHLRALAHRYRLQLILALRVTVAALSALAVAQAMHLRLPLWAVLTSLIVTQMSLGRSLKDGPRLSDGHARRRRLWRAAGDPDPA